MTSRNHLSRSPPINSYRQSKSSSKVSSNESHRSLSHQKVPLKITHDNNRLTINLASHSPDVLKQDNELTFHDHLKHSSTMSSRLERSSSIVSSRFRKLQNVLKPSKNCKNENIIKIIRENCERQKVMPCDTFIMPLLALSDYYTNENENNENSTAIDSLIKKTITSNTELALFQRQQSLALDKLRKKSKKKPKKERNHEQIANHMNKNIEQTHFGLQDGLKKNSSLISSFRQAYRSRMIKRPSSVDNINSEIRKKPETPFRNLSMPAYEDEHHRPGSENTKSTKIKNGKFSHHQSKRFTDSSVTTNSEINTSNCIRISMNPQMQNIDILAPDSLKGITNSIGDLIKILKSSSSSNSASNSDNNNNSVTKDQSIKLHALNAEIDKTMSEISKFKNEVSTRIMHHCDLNEYEIDLLNLLSPNEFLVSNLRNNVPEKVTIDTGVNTDISMCNSIFNVQYFENAKQNSFYDIQKSQRKNSYQNVKIDELWKKKNLYNQNFDNEMQTGFTHCPIIESPETSKNNSSNRGSPPKENINTSSISTNATTYSEPTWQQKPQLSNKNHYNHTKNHLYRQRNLNDVDLGNTCFQNYQQTYDQTYDEDSEVIYDENESSNSEQSKNVFKKIFTRIDYPKTSDDDIHYENYERARPISLVKIKKPNHIEYEKHQSGSSSSSTTNSPSMYLYNSGFQPIKQSVRILNRSSSANKQPLTKLPILEFAGKEVIVKKEKKPVQIPIPKKRSSTYDSTYTKSVYENQAPYTNYENDKGPGNDSINKIVTVSYNDPNLHSSRLFKSNSRLRFSSQEIQNSNGAQLKSSANMFPIVPIESYQSSNSNSKSYYNDALKYQNENEHFMNEPHQQQQDFWTLRGSEEKINDEIFLTLNDFKRPHSAFQIDNPLDENVYHNNNGQSDKNHQFVYSTEVAPLNFMKHGNDMNHMNSNKIKKENSPDFLQMRHINLVSVKRHNSLLKANKSVNQKSCHKVTKEPETHNHIHHFNESSHIKENNRVKRQKSEQPKKYFIHYPMSSSSIITNTYSALDNDTLSNADELTSTPEKQNSLSHANSIQKSKSIESTVMLKVYKLPNTSLSSNCENR